MIWNCAVLSVCPEQHRWHDRLPRIHPRNDNCSQYAAESFSLPPSRGEFTGLDAESLGSVFSRSSEMACCKSPGPKPMFVSETDLNDFRTMPEASPKRFKSTKLKSQDLSTYIQNNNTQAKYTEQSATISATCMLLRSIGTQGAHCLKQEAE